MLSVSITPPSMSCFKMARDAECAVWLLEPTFRHAITADVAILINGVSFLRDRQSDSFITKENSHDCRNTERNQGG